MKTESKDIRISTLLDLFFSTRGKHTLSQAFCSTAPSPAATDSPVAESPEGIKYSSDARNIVLLGNNKLYSHAFAAHWLLYFFQHKKLEGRSNHVNVIPHLSNKLLCMWYNHKSNLQVKYSSRDFTDQMQWKDSKILNFRI